MRYILKIQLQLEFMTARLPSLVIVGRPNVGKSTLFNRLTGTRRSIVTSEPGITRDRIYGKAEWRGKTLEVVDTGGVISRPKDPIPPGKPSPAPGGHQKAGAPRLRPWRPGRVPPRP